METRIPRWFVDLAAVGDHIDGRVHLAGRPYLLDRGVLCRADAGRSDAQAQTADIFGFKWNQRETFEGDAMVSKVRGWLTERYGDITQWWGEHGDAPVVLDAGCGAALSALTLFGPLLRSARYIGVDISDSVWVAASRCADQGVAGVFVRDDLAQLPLPAGCADVIFSEGVLHHTDSTRDSLLALALLLAPGGRFMFYVYNRKGPLREFTDDYIRDHLQRMSPNEAWEAIEPLTKLGIALGELDAEIEIPQDIGLLGIPAGRHNVQRLFYWHVAKAFYRPEMSFDELNHVNFDWYAPTNAHRQTPEQVRGWCAEAGLVVERESVQDAGITIIARRPG